MLSRGSLISVKENPYWCEFCSFLQKLCQCTIVIEMCFSIWALYRLQLMRYEKQTYISKSVVHTIVKPAKMFCFVCIIDSGFQVCYCYLHFNIKTAAKASYLLYLAFSYMKDIWFINLISFSPHWILEWFGMEWELSYSLLLYNPTIFYLFKVKNGNTRTICEIFSKLTINTSERRHWLQFEQISHIVLLFPLSTFSK